MATLQFIVDPAPRALFEQAASGFLRGAPDCLLVLRQGILRDDLYARARAAGVRGWVNPAICTFAELHRWTGTTARRPLGDVDRRALLAELLRRHGREVLHRGNRDGAVLRAVDQLVGELSAASVPADRFRAALEGDGTRDAFDRTRDAELAATYAAYLAALGDTWRDGRDTLADAARALRADPAGFAERLAGLREIRIVGLQDLRGGWPAMLDALAACPALDAVRVYSAVPLDGGAAPPAAGDGPSLRAIDAPDATRELDVVAQRVRALLDAGVPRERIAVVSREARPTVDLAADALERFGVPVTVRRRVALREVPAVRAVTALLAAAADGWSRHALAELAEHPYLDTGLDVTIVNHVGFRSRVAGLAAWDGALARLAAQAADAERRAESGDEDDRRAARQFPPSARIHEARAGFAGFAARVAALDEARPLGQWLDWLARLVGEDPFGIGARMLRLPDGDVRVARLDLRTWGELAGIVRTWQAALEAWGGEAGTLDAAAFAARLDELLDGDVILWSDTEHGVPVVEALGAAYHEVDHLFLVGMDAGRFPRRKPASPLLDEGTRQRLIAAGLPLDSRQTWELRERQLFDVLLAGAREVTLSWSRRDASGRAAIRSVYVEELHAAGRLAEDAIEVVRDSDVLIPGRRLLAGDTALAQAAHGARIELLRRTTAPSPWNGQITDPHLTALLARRFDEQYRWSPTQLESYAKCPWAFFSQRLLRLEQLADPDDDLEPRVRGTILHQALHRYFDGLPRPLVLDEPMRVATADQLAHALDAAIAAQGDTWLGHPGLAAARRNELLRILEKVVAREVEWQEWVRSTSRRKYHTYVQTAVDRHEVQFDGARLERNGIAFTYRGTIDRIDVAVDDRVDHPPLVAAIDYKTTKSSTPGKGEKKAWDDGVVLQVPLYAHALRTLLGVEVARVEYRALKTADEVHELHLYRVENANRGRRGAERAYELVPDADGLARMEQALDAAAAHVARVRRGEFPAAPPESCGCPSWCHGLDICRVAGGPRTKPW